MTERLGRPFAPKLPGSILAFLLFCGCRPAPAPAAPQGHADRTPSAATSDASAPHADTRSDTSAEPGDADCADLLKRVPDLSQDVPVEPSPPRDFSQLPKRGSATSAPSADNRVANGSAFDFGAVALTPGLVLVVPDDAGIAFGSPPGRCEFFLEKELGFAGHPGARLSPATARSNMGVATKTEGDKLVVATYGEWNSHIEGGAAVGLVVRVPEGSRVFRRPGLSGEDSATMFGPDGARHEQSFTDDWGAPAKPAPGWNSVPTRPDERRVARASRLLPHEFAERYQVAAFGLENDIAKVVSCLAALHDAEIMTCAKADPYVSGDLHLSWRILPNGTVSLRGSSRGVRSKTLEHGPIADCVADLAAHWTFPRGTVGTFSRQYQFRGQAMPDTVPGQ
jgi:hypothetical protein